MLGDVEVRETCPTQSDARDRTYTGRADDDPEMIMLLYVDERPEDHVPMYGCHFPEQCSHAPYLRGALTTSLLSVTS